MYTFLIKSVKFHLFITMILLVLLALLIEITYIVWNNKAGIQSLRPSLERLIVIAKSLLNLKKLLMLTKQRCLSFHRDLVFVTFSVFQIVISATEIILILFFSHIQLSDCSHFKMVFCNIALSVGDILMIFPILLPVIFQSILAILLSTLNVIQVSVSAAYY